LSKTKKGKTSAKLRRLPGKNKDLATETQGADMPCPPEALS